MPAIRPHHPRRAPLTLLTVYTLAAAAAAAAASAQPRTILPGLWEYKSDVLGSAKTEMRCIHVADIDKFFSGPSNGHYNCTYPVKQVSGGRARFVGVCVGKKHGEEVPVSWNGTYSPTSFALHGTLRATLGALTLPIAASVAAQRLAADCPA